MVSYTRYEMLFVTPSCQRICYQLKRLAKVLLCFDMRKSLRIFFWKCASFSVVTDCV